MKRQETSAQVVTRIWARFQSKLEAEHAMKFSKRVASASLLKGEDKHLLSRWTNPGSHPNWRIPLARIGEFCDAFDATMHERDELMFARLTELLADNEEQPAAEVHAALWGLERGREELDAEEQLVLAAWRTQRARWPRGLYDTGGGGQAPLEKAFDGLLREADVLHADEVRADREFDASPEGAVVHGRISAYKTGIETRVREKREDQRERDEAQRERLAKLPKARAQRELFRALRPAGPT